MPGIKQLLENSNGRIYIYLPDEATCSRFLHDAEAENFTFCDGVLPTSRQHSDLYAVNRNNTINYVGFVGHIAFGCADQIGEEKLIRIDYNAGCFHLPNRK